MIPLSNCFNSRATGALFTLLTLSDKKHDWLCSGGSTEPSPSHTWDELPWVKLSFHYPHFIFLSTQHWNVIEIAQPAIRSLCVWGGHSLSDPRNSILSLPLLLLNPPPPLIPPQRKWPRKRWFQFDFHSVGAEGVRLNAAPFLSTWTQTKVGVSETLHDPGMRFAAPFGVSTGGSECAVEGGREDAAALTDIQYTQLMPRTGKSNNIICAAGSQFIYYPICPPAHGGFEYGNSSQSCNARIRNLGTRRVRRLRGMIIGNQIERWGNCFTTTTIMSVPD